jgi:hypothetical protein
MAGDVNIIVIAILSNDPEASTLSDLLKGVNDVVGLVANVFQIVTVLAPLIEQALSEGPDTATILEEIQQTEQDILQTVIANNVQIKMLLLGGMFTTANSLLDNLAQEGPSGKDIDEPASFLGTQTFAMNFADNDFWIRPYLEDRAFYDTWFPNRGQPSVAISDGSTFVYDPQMSLPYFAAAINIFTSVLAIFHASDPQTAQPYFTDMATLLELNYQTVTKGLVMVPVPSLNDLSRIEEASGATDGQSLADEGLNALLQVWHGEIGVADIYAAFGGEGGYSSSLQENGFYLPTANAGNIIDVYPTVATLIMQFRSFPPIGLHTIPYVYPWFYVRMRLGNLVRFKALYLVKGYNLIWTLIQRLRFLSAGQPGTASYGYGATPPPEATDDNAHWRLSEIDGIFNELPVSYENWGPPWAPATPTNPKGLPLVTAEKVIQRLLSVIDNSTNHPIEEPPSLAGTQPRPLSLRKTIIAAAF